MVGLDMSLDGLIKNNKRSDGGDVGNRRGDGQRSGLGPTCRFNNRGAQKVTPYVVSKRGDLVWRIGMYVDQGIRIDGGRTSGMGRLGLSFIYPMLITASRMRILMSFLQKLSNVDAASLRLKLLKDVTAVGDAK
uniref:Uncharacterized protein n=1 Tax=Tanacetum cinerariifolium TaxID=118510 RepID=A0A6L2LWI1_TANCI|nr:hypothetical protein [Tanacetum cinerariifolium]